MVYGGLQKLGALFRSPYKKDHIGVYFEAPYLWKPPYGLKLMVDFWSLRKGSSFGPVALGADWTCWPHQDGLSALKGPWVLRWDYEL